MHDEILKQAKKAISECESKVQAFLRTAVAERQYDAVLDLTAWAKGLQELASGRGLVAQAPVNGQMDRLAKTSEKRRARPRRTPSGYPKFLRRGDDLIRIGWSKRGKQEYQHKAPATALDLVADTMADAGKGGQFVRPDQLLPIRDPADGLEVPNYQAYLCLAWLRDQDLVVRNGRQGYTVPRPAMLKREAQELWVKMSGKKLNR